jgi:hypothetical protein
MGVRTPSPAASWVDEAAVKALLEPVLGKSAVGDAAPVASDGAYLVGPYS